jgi:hypothetical protein
MNISNWHHASWATISTGAIVLLAGCTSAVEDAVEGERDELASSPSTPQVPAALAVPKGNKLAFRHDAIGVQIYRCDATATGHGWVFQSPEANLYGHKGRPAGTHYAGPTWQANDGSTVIAAKIAEAAATYSNAIPSLLLGATAHAGRGRMAAVTYIHRLETAGGVAPSNGCDAAHVGARVRVDYTATYYFYEARGKK